MKFDDREMTSFPYQKHICSYKIFLVSLEDKS